MATPVTKVASIRDRDVPADVPILDKDVVVPGPPDRVYKLYIHFAGSATALLYVLYKRHGGYTYSEPIKVHLNLNEVINAKNEFIAELTVPGDTILNLAVSNQMRIYFLDIYLVLAAQPIVIGSPPQGTTGRGLVVSRPQPLGRAVRLVVAKGTPPGVETWLEYWPSQPNVAILGVKKATTTISAGTTASVLLAYLYGIAPDHSYFEPGLKANYPVTSSTVAVTDTVDSSDWGADTLNLLCLRLRTVTTQTVDTYYTVSLSVNALERL